MFFLQFLTKMDRQTGRTLDIVGEASCLNICNAKKSKPNIFLDPENRLINFNDVYKTIKTKKHQ